MGNLARRFARALVWWLLGAFAIVVGTSCFVRVRYAARIFSISEVPGAPIAIVFGAGLASKGKPSPMLAERLDTAVKLYRRGKVEKVLVTGDNLMRSHDETKAMGRYAIGRGIPREVILQDDAGFSTYDSCYRAKEVFGVKRAILVTQRFHLPRALYIANSLGMDADGVAADDSPVGPLLNEGRELFSRSLALAMAIARPAPRFSGVPDSISAE
jgi:vancomycin permeability regulator SanA